MEIKPVRWRDALKEAKVDPVTGIRIARLNSLRIGGKLHETNVAEATRAIVGHFHPTPEVYHILEGRGDLVLGTPVKKGGKWVAQETSRTHVSSGQVVVISANTVHSLVPAGEKIVFIFSGPASHLGKDRTIVEKFVE